MKFSALRKLGLGVFLLGCTLSATAQDMISMQAPVDRKVRSVDSLALNRLIQRENVERPSGDLYSSWNTTRTHCYSQDQIPETYRIDLRNFAMPTDSRRITSRVGYRSSFRRYHKGLDIKVYVGDTIRSAFDGRVRIVDYEGGGYGKYIVIRHNNGLETIYAHLSKHLVSVNTYVKAGEPIGLGGNTGLSTGSHLHFECRLLGAVINPELLFDFPNQDVTGDYFVFHKSDNPNMFTGVASTASRKNKEMPAQTEHMAEIAPSRYHKVAAGENLTSIARKLEISLDALCKANHISATSHIRPGQILRY